MSTANFLGRDRAQMHFFMESTMLVEYSPAIFRVPAGENKKLEIFCEDFAFDHQNLYLGYSQKIRATKWVITRSKYYENITFFFPQKP